MALDEVGQRVGPARAPLSSDDDVLNVRRDEFVGGLTFDFPDFADAIVEVVVFIEGGVGSDEAHGAAVGGDAADAGRAAPTCSGDDCNEHESSPKN